MSTKKEMKSFATVEDLVDSWADIDTSDEKRARVILLNISNYLRLVARNNGINIDDRIKYGDPDGVYAENVKMVVCSAAQRVLSSPKEMMPEASQWSMSASPYSQSMSFGSSVSSTPFFKQRELELLGLKSISGKSQISILRGVR